MPSTAILIVAGLGIGLLVSAPIGPINILCIQRTLARGYWAGVVAGLGAVAGDALLATVAAFGVTAVTEGVAAHRRELQFVGGAILLAFGLRLVAARPPAVATPEHARLRGDAAALPQTFLLTVTNPGAVLGMFALVGALGSMLDGLGGYLHAGVLVASIVVGALLWWFGVAWIVGKLRHRIDGDRLRLVDRFAGVVLLGFGTGLLARALTAWFGCDPIGWCG